MRLEAERHPVSSYITVKD